MEKLMQPSPNILKAMLCIEICEFMSADNFSLKFIKEQTLQHE